MERLVSKKRKIKESKDKLVDKLDELYNSLSFSKMYRSRVGIVKQIKKREKEVEYFDRVVERCDKEI